MLMRSLVGSCGLILLSLSGCGSVITATTSDVAGVAGAGVGSAITNNGAVTAAIGLGVQSVASAGLRLVERRVHRTEQNRIAAAAAALPVGGVASWNVEHDLPIEDDEHGQVAVSRQISADPLDCKEIVFSVDTVEDHKPTRAFYVAAICRDGDAWHWASAEPATARWGSIQ